MLIDSQEGSIIC